MTKRKNKTTLSLEDIAYIEERQNARKELTKFKEWWLAIRATGSEWTSADALAMLNNIVLENCPQNAGALKQLHLLKSQMNKRKTSNSLGTIEKCQRLLHATSNENPFEINDKVGIIRTEHGWHDGNIEGTITTRSGSVKNGFSYSADVEDDGYRYSVSIEHTRDAYKLR